MEGGLIAILVLWVFKDLSLVLQASRSTAHLSLRKKKWCPLSPTHTKSNPLPLLAVNRMQPRYVYLSPSPVYSGWRFLSKADLDRYVQIQIFLVARFTDVRVLPHASKGFWSC